jgi:hypothetical protein
MAAFSRNLMAWTRKNVLGAKPSPIATPDLPAPPERDALGETEAVTRARKRKMGSARASSIKTGPSGTTTDATTERKTLLGY